MSRRFRDIIPLINLCAGTTLPLPAPCSSLLLLLSLSSSLLLSSLSLLLSSSSLFLLSYPLRGRHSPSLGCIEGISHLTELWFSSADTLLIGVCGKHFDSGKWRDESFLPPSLLECRHQNSDVSSHTERRLPNKASKAVRLCRFWSIRIITAPSQSNWSMSARDSLVELTFFLQSDSLWADWAL